MKWPKWLTGSSCQEKAPVPTPTPNIRFANVERRASAVFCACGRDHPWLQNGNSVVIYDVHYGLCRPSVLMMSESESTPECPKPLADQAASEAAAAPDPRKVCCVEMSHPEGTETEAVCATPEAARRWIAENRPDYVETRRKKSLIL